MTWRGVEVRPAEVVGAPDASNGYRWVVKSLGETLYLSGPGAPKDAKVGDTGTLTYISTASRGGWSWSCPSCASS